MELVVTSTELSGNVKVKGLVILMKLVCMALEDSEYLQLSKDEQGCEKQRGGR